MTDVVQPLPPFEAPEPPPPPKRWFLFVCDDEHPMVAMYVAQSHGLGHQKQVPTMRRATEADLEKLGFVRKNG